MIEHACSNCGVTECQRKVPGRRLFLKQTVGSAVAALAIGFPLLGVVEASDTSGTERRYPIPAADGASIDRSHQVILVRSRSQVFAFALSCPHQNTALKWLPKDGRFQCPKHESRYKPDGTFIDGRATRNMDRFAIRLDAGSVVVDLSKWFQSDRDPHGWASAVVGV
jgi:nitrite reductase/ring-hydroxylating ferredoxin subunit